MINFAINILTLERNSVFMYMSSKCVTNFRNIKAVLSPKGRYHFVVGRDGRIILKGVTEREREWI
jgi:hypothetical protein